MRLQLVTLKRAPRIVSGLCDQPLNNDHLLGTGLPYESGLGPAEPKWILRLIGSSLLVELEVP